MAAARPPIRSLRVFNVFSSHQDSNVDVHPLKFYADAEVPYIKTLWEIRSRRRSQSRPRLRTSFEFNDTTQAA